MNEQNIAQIECPADCPLNAAKVGLLHKLGLMMVPQVAEKGTKIETYLSDTDVNEILNWNVTQ